MTRRILTSIACLAAAIACGLAWRMLPLHLPYFAWKYGGSLLWAIALYWLVAALLPRASIVTLTTTSAILAAAVECSRLVTAPAWVHFRHTLAGKLLIGNIFSVRNIVAYWLGIALAALLDHTLRTRR